jgi:hypothetical protein
MTDALASLRGDAMAQPPAGAADVETVVAATPEAALPSLWSYFGVDDDRALCRLVVAEEDVGFIARASVLAAMADQVRSVGLGDASAGAMVPGASTAYVEIELRCDEPGCALNPIRAFVYDPDFPPHCPLHPQRVLHPPEAG